MNDVYFYFYLGGKVFKYRTFRSCEYQLLRKLRVKYKKHGYVLPVSIQKRVDDKDFKVYGIYYIQANYVHKIYSF